MINTTVLHSTREPRQSTRSAICPPHYASAPLLSTNNHLHDYRWTVPNRSLTSILPMNQLNRLSPSSQSKSQGKLVTQPFRIPPSCIYTLEYRIHVELRSLQQSSTTYSLSPPHGLKNLILTHLQYHPVKSQLR